jgi:carboxyl-terminal processing protease
MHAMLNSIDIYSLYLNKTEVEMPTLHSYIGFGFAVDPKSQVVIPRIGWTIANVWNKTTAERHGIKSGDQILSIKEASVAETIRTDNLTIEQVRQKLLGPLGSLITLNIGRCYQPFNCTTFEVLMQRKHIVIPSIHTKYLSLPIRISNTGISNTGTSSIGYSNIGYVWIREIAADTEREVRDAVQDMISQYNIRRVILDLRWNPGGLYQSALSVAGLFLRRHMIVASRSGRKNEGVDYTNYDGPFFHLPVTILVNNQTASAAEVLAGVLQDHRTGGASKKETKIYGTRTFGKNLIQENTELPQIGAKFRFTSSKWYTPFGYDVQGRGLSPDVSVKPNESDQSLYEQYDDEYTFLIPQWSLDDLRDSLLYTAVKEI